MVVLHLHLVPLKPSEQAVELRRHVLLVGVVPEPPLAHQVPVERERAIFRYRTQLTESEDRIERNFREIPKAQASETQITHTVTYMNQFAVNFRRN